MTEALQAFIAAAGGAAAVAVPVVSWLVKTESRLTRVETLLLQGRHP